MAAPARRPIDPNDPSTWEKGYEVQHRITGGYIPKYIQDEKAKMTEEVCRLASPLPVLALAQTAALERADTLSDARALLPHSSRRSSSDSRTTRGYQSTQRSRASCISAGHVGTTSTRRRPSSTRACRLV